MSNTLVPRWVGWGGVGVQVDPSQTKPTPSSHPVQASIVELMLKQLGSPDLAWLATMRRRNINELNMKTLEPLLNTVIKVIPRLDIKGSRASYLVRGAAYYKAAGYSAQTTELRFLYCQISTIPSVVKFLFNIFPDRIFPL